MNSFHTANRPPLAGSAMSFLPLGTIKPRGWLQRQLRIQADGLSGNLANFWPDLGPDSGWLGGEGESWERGPYFLDGYVPLAYLLEDEEMIATAKKWVDWALENQKENGWIGPELNTDWWPIGVMLKVLTQYEEVTGDPRVIPIMKKFFAQMKEELPSKPLVSWAVYRWADTAISAIWLYNRTGDESLLEFARLIMRQGYDWARHFTTFELKKGYNGCFRHETHIVNNAMGIKTPGVMYELTGDEFFKQAAYNALNVLDEFHGQANGMFSGDEHLAGKNPSHGTELCAVVETMFSLERLVGVFGDTFFADRLEKITFNALPATFAPDMWSHQYDQQTNQVQCKNDEDNWWVDNGPDSNLFGLEPNFGCCTANMHQGWPKFVSHLWMATPDDGLAAVAYAPCLVKSKVRGGVEVSIEVETNYPFEDSIKIKLEAPQPATFPLWLRVPAWAKSATLLVDGQPHPAKPGEFAVIEREWGNTSTIELVFKMEVTVERRFNDSVTVLRGPLVYSLVVGDKWVKHRGEEPHADYELYPTTQWNYGLIIDTESPEKSVKITNRPAGDPVFSPEDAPIIMKASGRLVPEWQMQHNAAGTLPESPVTSEEPIQELTLIPYGCTNLRITEFPLIENS